MTAPTMTAEEFGKHFKTRAAKFADFISEEKYRDIVLDEIFRTRSDEDYQAALQLFLQANLL
jgi:hypothetical protein